MKGTERKVIFQGVHQLMGSDLGPKWAPGEKKTQQDGVHRHRPAARHPAAGPGAVPGLNRAAAALAGGYNPRRLNRRPPAHSRLAMRGRAAAARRHREHDRRQEDSTVQGAVERQARPARQEGRRCKKKPRPPRPAGREEAVPGESPPAKKAAARPVTASSQGARQGRRQARRQGRRQAGRQARAKTASAKAAPARPRPPSLPAASPAAKPAVPPPRPHRRRRRRPRRRADACPAGVVPRKPAAARRSLRRRRPGAAAAADLTLRRPVRAAPAADPPDEQRSSRHPARSRRRPTRSWPTPGRPRAGRELTDAEVLAMPDSRVHERQAARVLPRQAAAR